MEKAIKFRSGGKALFAVLHLPDNSESLIEAVVMVVGGPQTRVGSHRLYVHVARKIVSSERAVLRFDYEGIGDSEGFWRGYKFAGPSIEATILALREKLPQIRRIVIWSLCDGSTSSAVFAALRPELVDAMILCNPYVHSEQGKAQALLKYYYIKRLMDKEFWKKVGGLRYDVGRSLNSLLDNFRQAKKVSDGTEANGGIYRNEIHPNELVRSLLDYDKPIHFILSADDLTAQQFVELCKNQVGLRAAIKSGRITLSHVRDADHTFTTRASKYRLIQETRRALDSLLNRQFEKPALTVDVVDEMVKMV